MNPSNKNHETSATKQKWGTTWAFPTAQPAVLLSFARREPVQEIIVHLQGWGSRSENTTTDQDIPRYQDNTDSIGIRWY